MKPLRVAMLHLSPVVADVEHNRTLAEQGLARAAEMGAQWVITPELFITGYKFAEVIGTDWILPQPDEWMQRFCGQVAQHGVTVFLSHPERDPDEGLMYNTVFVIGPDGRIIGRHRKVKALRGPEAWSSPGAEIAPIPVPVDEIEGQVPVGVVICADAYKNDVAGILQERGREAAGISRIVGTRRLWAAGRVGAAHAGYRAAHHGLQPLRLGGRRPRFQRGGQRRRPRRQARAASLLRRGIRRPDL